METKEYVDLLVIGGGSAGMAAALSAYRQGVSNILIVERSGHLGGILLQCIHNGFGLHTFGEDLTGTEYAARYCEKIEECKIPVWTHTFVIDLTKDRIATVVSPQFGLCRVHAKAVVLAMGCRERTRGALLIPGSRPAGVLTAGTAQRYLNLMGYLPGRRAVILGSGDIGLIMARQLALEGVEVIEVVEIQPFSSGLPRNIAQCLDDFNIPLRLNSTVTAIHGRARVEGVTVSSVGKNRVPVPGTERYLPCDTLIISAGLIPENELTRQAGVTIDSDTGGAMVNQYLMSETAGIFACGNVLHVHDLVDQVSKEGTLAGKYAADYILGNALPSESRQISLCPGKDIRALIPQRVSLFSKRQTIQISFRPARVFQKARVVIRQQDRILHSVTVPVLNPGELQQIAFSAGALSDDPMTVSIEE